MDKLLIPKTLCKTKQSNKTIKQNYISPSLDIIGIALESKVLVDSGYECASVFDSAEESDYEW